MEDILTEATGFYNDILEKIDNEARELELKIKTGEVADKDEIEQWSNNWQEKAKPLNNFLQQIMQGGSEEMIEDVEYYVKNVKSTIKDFENDLLELYTFSIKVRNEGNIMMTDATLKGIKEAKSLKETMLAEIDMEVKDIQNKLNNGKLVTVEEIKEWRRGWMDKIVPIRKLAKQAKADGDEDEGDEIKDIAYDLETYVKDLESELKDDADKMEEAQERGGILTKEERMKLAYKEGQKTFGFYCPNCGAALPESDSEFCGYCGSAQGKDIGKVSRGWVLLQEEAANKSASPKVVFQAAMERIDALNLTFMAQLESEKKGLYEILEAGKKRTVEFNNAMDDSGDRLDRIWDRIREVGQKAENRLSDLGASNLEDQLDDHYSKTCDRLLELQRSVMDGIERKAKFKWDKNQDGSDYEVKCSHCGAKLGIINPEQPGEATCPSCQGVTRYSAHITELDVTINKIIDKQMDDQMPLEDQFQNWKAKCIANPSEENKAMFEAAARAMYDKQLFYIKDDAKRKVNVDRYVAQALKEIK
ncbi:MAG: zinc ribbon domain-containing protein [Bacteroidales bacterium]|nr:zinc ribbon domain-containing protein [Bacteroidales bacterium]